MQKKQEQARHSLEKVLAFIAAHPELTADTPEGRAFAARKAALQSTFEAVNAAATIQVTSAAGRGLVGSNQQELKRQLRVHLTSIAEVARGLTSTVPGIGVLRIPSIHIRNQTLIGQASAFAEQTRIYESVLVEHGLPTDIVAQLEASINAFRECIVGRSAARAKQLDAASEVRQQLAVGRAIVTGMNGVIHGVFNGRKEALTGWRAAKRIDPLPVRSQLQTLGTSVNTVHSLASLGEPAVTSSQTSATSGQPSSTIGQGAPPVDPAGVTSAQRAA